MATQSPYVAESGSVGELGQPTPGDARRGEAHSSEAPVDRGLPAEPGKDRGVGKSGGLHDGGAYGDAESRHPEAEGSETVGAKVGDQRHGHDLMATHDTNIPHGHDPLTSSEYVAASPTAGDHHQKKGVGEKLKHAARGFKDVVTGHKEKQPQPQGEGSPGLAGKVNNTVTGQYPGQGTATGNAKHGRGDVPKHETGWPKPVPPPSMYNPTLTGPPEHYSPKADPTPVEDHAPKYAREQAGVQGRKEVESTPELSGSSAETNEARPTLSSTPDARADKHSVDDTSALQSSTPAEPNVKHDVPSVDNTGGEYTDPAGKVHQEGPRDDNVKKEGLLSKVMDKLHLGSHDREKHPTA